MGRFLRDFRKLKWVLVAVCALYLSVNFVWPNLSTNTQRGPASENGLDPETGGSKTQSASENLNDDSDQNSATRKVPAQSSNGTAPDASSENSIVNSSENSSDGTSDASSNNSEDSSGEASNSKIKTTVKIQDPTKCKIQNYSKDEKKQKAIFAHAAALKYLKNRRCNSFLSGNRGEAIKVLDRAKLGGFCASDYHNALRLLRRVGNLAGKQDVDEHNDFVTWIDCFCNVTGKNICPPIKTAKPRDDYDIQEPFDPPSTRAPTNTEDESVLQSPPPPDNSGAEDVLADP